MCTMCLVESVSSTFFGWCLFLLSQLCSKLGLFAFPACSWGCREKWQGDKVGAAFRQINSTYQWDAVHHVWIQKWHVRNPPAFSSHLMNREEAVRHGPDRKPRYREKKTPTKSQMSPRRLKTMASTEDRKEQQESSDTPEDQTPVTRQRKPSVDSTGRPQVLP